MIYFISDIHLGLPTSKEALYRERKLINWIDKIKDKASEIYFMGDVFEFWYEWKYVIPKHFSRFFGKLCELSDLGIKLHFFIGNHDLWAYGYFEDEFEMKIYTKPLIKQINNKRFYLAHGDGLGPNDKMYKLMKKLFLSKFLQWIFSNLLHPNLAFRIALLVSHKREKVDKKVIFKGKKEWLVQHAENVSKDEKCDFFVFGHRHVMVDYELSNKTKMIILGDWISNFSYAVFDGNNMELKKFDDVILNRSQNL